MGKIQQVVTTDKKKINKTIFAGFVVLIFLMISKYVSAWKKQKTKTKTMLNLSIEKKVNKINKNSNLK